MMGKSVIEKLIEIIDNRLKIFKDTLQFDKTYYGRIKTLDGEKCVVTINEIDYNSKTKKGINLTIGDTAIVKSPNGNFSDMYIDGKIGDVSNEEDKVGDLSSLTTEDKSNVVGAVNELDSEIGNLSEREKVLEIERGYLTSKILKNTNLDNIKSNGLYVANSHVSNGNTNTPTVGQDITYTVMVSSENGDAIAQLAMSTYPTSVNTIWKRGYFGGTWTSWAQVATTAKTEFLFTPTTGYTITSNISKQINNILYVDVTITKTDGGSFTTGGNAVVCSSPKVLGIDKQLVATLVNTGVGYVTSPYTCFTSGSEIVLNISSGTVKKVNIGGVIVL